MLVTRTLNMFRNLRNPGTYLAHKAGLLKRDPLMFRLGNDVVAEVPVRLLPTFKESVFAEDYIKGFPPEVVRRFGNSAVIDVGANVGYFSLWWLSRYPRSTVVAVEPMPNNFALLKRNAALNPGKAFHPVNCAAGSKVGELVLHFDSHDSFTTSASVMDGAGGRDELRVKSVPLAQVAADFKLGRIGFLKMDCEGSEYDTLYSCEDALLDRIDCISMETHAGRGANQDKAGMCGFLRSKNFSVHETPASSMVYAWRATAAD